MISAWDIYLIGSADGISTLLGFMSFVFFIFSVIILIYYFCNRDNYYSDQQKEKEEFADKTRNSFKLGIFSAIFFATISCIIPSSKTLAAIYVIPTVLKSVQDNKQVQQIPQAVLDLIKSYENKEEK